MSARVATSNVPAKPAKAKFSWEDPLLIEQSLSDDERLVLETTKRYCTERLMPRVLEANRHETFDRAIMTEMANSACWGP